MKSRAFLLTALTTLALALSACRTPLVPPEIDQAKEQENDLWRAGAAVYAAEDYASYLSSLRLARDKLIKQKARFGWFRDYGEVEADFKAVLERGQDLLQKVEEEKSLLAGVFSTELAALRHRSERIRGLVLTINENQLVRRSLTQAEVALREAEILLEKEKYTELRGKIGIVNSFLDEAGEAVFSLLARYADDHQIRIWRKWAEETIAESRKKRAVAIIINKLERSLTVYKGGKVTATYSIGLGKFGLSDKLHAGDEATPEGRYRIVKKIPRSRFYKALLLDYPNEEDRREFNQARKEGRIPARASIGGLIEIHGGGEDSLTGGCIAVEDSVMDKLFSEVTVGAPVAIVGSLKSAAELLASLRRR